MNGYFRLMFSLPIIAGLICFSTDTHAYQIFFNKADFSALTKPSEITWPAASDERHLSYTVDNITLSNPTSFYFSPSWTNTDLIPGSEIAIIGPENLNIDIATPINAFGFDFVELTDSVGGYIDSTFEIKLFYSDVLIENSIIFNAQDDRLSFIGLVCENMFNRVEIREVSDNRDDEYYGNFYTSILENNTSPVPEPTTMSLLGIGLIGIVGARRGLKK